MKIYTNDNNTATLKLLVAANIAGKKITLQKYSFEDVFTGPKCLPVLEVDENVSFFSSNAATQYLFPIIDLTDHGQYQQMQEWEATKLQPAIATLLSSKSVGSDLKQNLQALLDVVESYLTKHKYILGDKLSAVDISIWSTLYPLCFNKDLKQTYLAETKNINRWAEELSTAKAVQEAIKQWGGTAEGPFGAQSALGIPQMSNIVSPVGSPDESQVAGPTAEEIETAKDNWLHGVQRLQEPLKQEKVVLPIKGRRNVLITSALPYVNNIPHLGNIIGCVLSADIFARYCRLCDYNTMYISGTDEYGTATETKALEEGVSPREICDKYFEIHNAVYRWFDIGFDYFGRTSTSEQKQIAQKLFLKLRDNCFISTQTVDQLYCDKCERFLADRFVEGICPHPGCLYDNARGDQCDRCGKLINAIELGSPRCKVCGAGPGVRPSSQLFLELGQLEPAVRTWISKSEAGWSGPARAVARGWLREPLRARAITRDLKWGVPVPVPEYSNKVFYVWFDAPIGYLSITECATRDHQKWWRPDKEYDVQLYQFMAKDNVPFHAIMFPATLLGINDGYTLVKHIYATEYLNYEDGKFSKSRGVGVFGNDAQDTGIPSDVWRFYLASIRPEGADSSFSWVELGTRNNSELLNNIGNFCHRSLSFCANSFKGRVPELTLTAADYELFALVNREVAAYVQHMEKGRLREALRHVLAVSRLGNQHMQAAQPWVLLKGSDDDKVRGATAVGVCCQLVALLATLLAPYIPAAARKLQAQLNLPADRLRINPLVRGATAVGVCCQLVALLATLLAPYIPAAARKLQAQLNLPADRLRINPLNPSLIQYLPAGHTLGTPAPLFAKIEPELLEKLRQKYAGSQADRANQAKGAGGKSSVADLEAAVAAQGEKVRQLKASTKDKAVWQPEVNKLLELKKQLTEAQKNKENQSTNGLPDVAELEKAIAAQGDKVRQLKASTKDKAVWQPEVNKLLELKKQLAAAQATPPAVATPTGDVASLEKAVAEQGDKVRQLKASTKDKAVWQPEVNKLLELKKQLAAAQATPPAVATPPATPTADVASLEKAVAQQGDKVRQLKASTKDKAVWQPEVNKLLDLKKQLAEAQKNA